MKKETYLISNIRMSEIEQLDYLDYLSQNDKNEYKGQETWHKNLIKT